VYALYIYIYVYKDKSEKHKNLLRAAGGANLRDFEITIVSGNTLVARRVE
jgi:hypothetical protein